MISFSTFHSAFHAFSVHFLDAALGWSLGLPRDVTIVVLGIVVGLNLFAIRRFTIAPKRLAAISSDEAQLRGLLRSARQAANRETIGRLYLVRNLVRSKRVQLELPATILSVALLLILLPWAQLRLELYPITLDTPFRFQIRTPAAAIGEIAYIVPDGRLGVEGGWIKRVVPTHPPDAAGGIAEWVFVLKKHSESSENPSLRSQITSVTVRFANHTLSHPVAIGNQFRRPDIQSHAGMVQTEVIRRPYSPLTLLPAHPLPGLPSWSVFLACISAATFFSISRISRRSP